MGWSTLSVAMTYIHPDEKKVLGAFSSCTNFCTATNEGNFGEVGGSGQTVEESEGYMVSAAGFEPATHALKGHCSAS
jgi:hypothetical protein